MFLFFLTDSYIHVYVLSDVRAGKNGKHSYLRVYVLSDVGAGKNGKENVTNQILDKSVGLSSVPNVEAKNISR